MGMKVLYGILWCWSFAPWWMTYALSDLICFLLHRVIRYRRSTVRMNLKNSFPKKSAAELALIEKRFYRNFCDTFAETIKLWHISAADIRKRMIFTNPELLNSCLESGRSAMTVNGHFGNWEMLTSYALAMPDNCELLPLYKPLHNKTMDRLMLNIRSHFGAHPIHKKEMIRRILTGKRAGKTQIISFVGDQRPRKANSHMWLEFLNQDTAVFPGAEKISELFDLAVFYVWIEKKSRGHYSATFIKICDSSKGWEYGRLTRAHTEQLERNINNSPELWLWSHSRWKHKRESSTQQTV